MGNKENIGDKHRDIKMLESIIGLVPGHVYWIDRDGTYLGCNDEQARAAGLASRHDIVGLRNQDLPWNKNAGSLVHELDDTNYYVMHSGKSIVIEENAISQRGKHPVYLSNKAPLYMNNEIVGMVGMSIDITHIKELEKELLQAKEHAELSNRLKTDFMMGLQHDIRTPITGIGLLLRRILNADSWDKCVKLLPYAIKAINELIMVCNELINLDDLAECEKSIKHKRFNITSVLANISNLYMPIALSKGIKFSIEKYKNVHEYYVGDEYRIKKIILNLLDNAFKFTENGEIILKIEFLSDLNALKIIVKDTGKGISKELMPYIFNKYIHGAASDCDSIHLSSGLGLYMVKKFVDELDGDININSQPGKGTIVEVSCVVDRKIL